MGEPETTKSFEMFLSDRRLIPVTDPVKIRIMAVLSDSDRTLADMSRILEVPLSTLFSNLNKMVDDGLIESYSHSDDKRKVLYSMKAVKLIESIQPEPTVASVASEVLKLALEDPSNFYRSIVTYVNMATSMTGLDIGPVFERGGRIMANIMKDYFKCDRVEDLIPKLKEFADAAKMPKITVFTFVPLTIILQLDYSGTDKTYNLFRATKGFIAQALTNHTGMVYNVTSMELFGDGFSKLKFVLEPDPNMKDKTSEVLSGNDMDVAIVGSDTYFELYATKTGILYNSNDTQIKIMHELAFGAESTLSDLARKLDISQSTIFANLNKMVADGLIDATGSDMDNRKVVYKAISARFMKKKDVSSDSYELAYRAMMKAKDDPSIFFRSLFEFLVYETNILGLDFTDTAEAIGMSLSKVVKDMYPDVTVEQYVNMLCKNSTLVGAKSFSVVTYIPLTIRMSCFLDPTEAISQVVMKFYGGFLSVLLTLSSGTTYVVTTTHELIDGELSYEYVLESSPNSKLQGIISDMLGNKN